jgi:uncharacterized protein
MNRVHEPARLDVAAFAADAGDLAHGQPLSSFGRLADVVPEGVPPERVEWSARGALRRPGALEPEVWLHLQARACVWMTCQRCLQPVAVPVEIDRRLRFVRGEDEAARLDAESEDDVLELERTLDLPALVEDELLLALPLVPRHDRCPQPLTPAAESPPADEQPPRSPFAALAALKRRP